MSRPTLPLFPTDEGWPYTDLVRGPDLVDDGEIDLDALELRADPTRTTRSPTPSARRSSATSVCAASTRCP